MNHLSRYLYLHGGLCCMMPNVLMRTTSNGCLDGILLIPLSTPASVSTKRIPNRPHCPINAHLTAIGVWTRVCHRQNACPSVLQLSCHLILELPAKDRRPAPPGAGGVATWCATVKTCGYRQPGQQSMKTTCMAICMPRNVATLIQYLES